MSLQAEGRYLPEGLLPSVIPFRRCYDPKPSITEPRVKQRRSNQNK